VFQRGLLGENFTIFSLTVTWDE